MASSSGTAAKVEEAEAAVELQGATPGKASANLSKWKRVKGESDEASGSCQLVRSKRGQYSNWFKDDRWKTIQMFVEKEQNLTAALHSLKAGYKTAANPDGVYAKLALSTLRSWFLPDGNMREAFKERLGREKMDMRGKVGILTRFSKLESELKTDLKLLKQRGFALTVPLVQQRVQRHLEDVYPEILDSGFLVSPTWCARFLRERMKYTVKERVASGFKFRGKHAERAKNLGPLPPLKSLPPKKRKILAGSEKKCSADEEVDMDDLEDKEEASEGLKFMTANGAKLVRNREGIERKAKTKARELLAAIGSDDDPSTSPKDAARHGVEGGPANASKPVTREKSKLREMRQTVEERLAAVKGKRKQRSCRKDCWTGPLGEGAAGQGEASSASVSVGGNGAQLEGGDGEAQEASTAVGQNVAARKSSAANKSSGAGRSTVKERRLAIAGSGTRGQEGDGSGENHLVSEKRIRRKLSFAEGSKAEEYGSLLRAKVFGHAGQKNAASASHNGQENLSAVAHDGRVLALTSAEESVSVGALSEDTAEESVSVGALSEDEKRSPKPQKPSGAIRLPGAFGIAIPSPSKTFVGRYSTVACPQGCPP
eukprot:TRINITY_DN6311_c0_g1_i3.p1 TRINITY_DN6311_c0_g1~~TRINITY_DN6311_c0_g1_i3.p1  ORF type:complete len:599 (-),score=98.16 TRINITY_DN6311_c0_g1_i3:143-1939(-)